MAEDLSQARYERALLGEISKLQSALLEERNTMAAQKAQMENAVSAERERKAEESEKASRLQAMEAAIQEAQNKEQKDFLRKRAAAEARMQAKEALATKQRKEDAKRKEEQRQLAQQLHEEQLKRTAAERAQADEAKRQADERKEAKLQARMAEEREQLVERNVRKAEESAEKVMRAADQRKEQTRLQREAHARRTAAQQERMRQQQAQQERKQASIKAAAELKAQVIERAQAHQQESERQRKNEILRHEADKQQRLDLKYAREQEARRLLQHEKVLQEAAARGRVERTMGDLQAQLYALEGQIGSRQAKLDGFMSTREAVHTAGQYHSVRSSLERADLANSMGKMRSNLTNTATLYLEVPADHRGGVQNRELKALLDKVDPDGDGHIPLSSLRKTLTKLLPPLPASDASRQPRIMSQSLPSLLTLEQKTSSAYDQYLAAFNAVDTDGSGTISKRELYTVLEKSGLTNGKQALEVFSGFDKDSDGQLDFEEFTKIAKILC